MRSFLRATALLAVLMTASACEDTIVKPELEAGGTFQVRPSLLRITNGDEGSLSAVAFDSDRAVFTGAVEWTSLDPEIASVDETGRVSGLTAGWARVVGTSTTTGLTDTAAVSVALRQEGVSGGYEHLCGWTVEGSAYCWGSSNSARYGVFGTGGEATYFTPNAVTGGLAFSTISAGYLHTCGLADGVPYCWGRSMRGLVSCPVFSPFGCFSPIRVVINGATFAHIDSSPYLSDAACASGSAGAACWGQGSQVQPINCSGNGCVGIRFPSITGDVAVGYGHACGLDASGRAYCWGNNSKGQLGAVFSNPACTGFSCTSSDTLIAVATSERFTDLTAGTNFTCGVTLDGRVLCWGAYFWTLTVGPGAAPGAPVVVDASLRASSIEAAMGHVCAVATDGALYCWGTAAQSGALGKPLLNYDQVVEAPRRVMAGHSFRAAAASSTSTCGITTEGETLCIGDGSTVPLPVAPPGPLPDYVPGRD